MNSKEFIDLMEQHKIFSITWSLENCPLDEVKNIEQISYRQHEETPVVFRYEVVLHKGYLFEEANQEIKVGYDRIELENDYALYIPILYTSAYDPQLMPPRQEGNFESVVNTSAPKSVV